MTSVVFAKVALIKDNYNLVINKGSFDNVSVGDRFTIYRLGEDITDPDTGELLGALEEVLAKVEATHVQDRMTTVISIDFDSTPSKTEIKKIAKGNNITFIGALSGLGSQEITTTIPGEKKRKTISHVKKGDFVSEGV